MPLHGIINFNKPVGPTSAQSLYRVRAITGQRKSGHAGTLDRLADGVLVLCLGKATKLVESIMDQPKVYRTRARLDVTSKSFDSGEPLLPVEITQLPTPDSVADALHSFVGEIQQVPPRISALKVGGVPAHRRTRKNEDFELHPRPIRIYWIHLHGYEWPTIDFEVCCGRGTYIRALIRDVGDRLHVGGCLTSLTRTCVGPFERSNSSNFESLEAASDPSEYLIDVEAARSLLDPERIVIPPKPAGTPS